MNNKGLVEFANEALEQKWGYVWGTFGKILTPALLEQKMRQYPDGVGNYYGFIKNNWLGRKTADCVGLIKAYYWSKEGKVCYDPITDVTADGMLLKATEKGHIDSIPDIPGICVHKKGHIGIYIGNGQVIESHGTKYGVIKTPLKGTGATGWTSWLKCPYIDYITEEVEQDTNTIIEGLVTASVLNVRDGAGTNYSILGKLKKGAKVKIDKRYSQGDWYSIYYGEHGGFVHKNYIKLI